MKKFLSVMMVAGAAGAFMGTPNYATADDGQNAVPIEKSPLVLKKNFFWELGPNYSTAEEGDKKSIVKILEENPGCVVQALDAGAREFKALASSKELLAMKDKTAQSVALEKLIVGYKAARSSRDSYDQVSANVTSSWTIATPDAHRPKVGMICTELAKAEPTFTKCTVMSTAEVRVQINLGAFPVGNYQSFPLGAQVERTCNSTLITVLNSEIDAHGELVERVVCEVAGLSLCSPENFVARTADAKAKLERAMQAVGTSIDTVLAAEKKVRDELEEKERRRVKEEQSRKRMQEEREKSNQQTRKLLDEVGTREQELSTERTI